VIAAEARERPDFAERLAAAMDAAIGAPQNPDELAQAPAFSFVAVLHLRGEEELRALLQANGDPAALLRAAEEQHIPVADGAEERGLAGVIDAVVEGAHFRLADRLAAAS
jgi:hypothetical protein